MAERRWHFRGLAAVLTIVGSVQFQSGAAAQGSDDQEVAERLAELLRSARTVISGYQDLINDPNIADKSLTGDRVLAEAKATYVEKTGEDPAATDPQSREGRLLRVLMDAIVAVVTENQSTINAPGLAFKGFIVHSGCICAASQREVP